MPPALTPALALDYVRELSADVIAVILLDADHDRLAGPSHLQAPAAALARAAEDAEELEAVTPDGVVCAVRSPTHHMVAVCGRFALPGVVRQDLRTALAAIEGTTRPPAATLADDTPDGALKTAANALISAAQREFEA
jgi:hypothetical protein